MSSGNGEQQPKQGPVTSGHQHSTSWPTFDQTQTVFESVHGRDANLTRNLVMVHTKVEDVSWAFKHLDGAQDLTIFDYCVDCPNPSNHIPKNKGHEVMPYLTYIIDHYDSLPDVSIFMHAHRFAWHNNELLDGDAVEMIKRLSLPKVVRDGYFNMRCSYDPGCPDHLHPNLKPEELSISRPQEVYMALVWDQIFPGEKVPEVLAQPCCAQFAVSAERIRLVPLARFKSIQRWLIGVDLPDKITGRIWEYAWQFLFTGQAVFCPEPYIAYCDGFGVCFGGKVEHDHWWEMRKNYTLILDEIEKLLDSRTYDGQYVSDEGRARASELRLKAEQIKGSLVKGREEALARGNDPAARAKEAGRVWRPEHGF